MFNNQAKVFCLALTHFMLYRQNEANTSYTGYIDPTIIFFAVQ